MAYYSQTELVAVLSEVSPKDQGKKQVLDASTKSPIPSTHQASLPSSPDSQSPPYGKSHAGEVRRRTDRQTGALPAPGVGQSGNGNSTNGSSRRQRRSNGSNHEGYNSDSDEDEDRKRRTRYGDPDDDAAIVKREERPAPSSSHYVETSNRYHRSMRQALAFAEEKLAHYASPDMQRQQMTYLAHSLPPDRRHGDNKSEIYNSMLEYLGKMRERVIDIHTAALMRQHTNSSSADEGQLHESSLMVRQSKVTFQYLRLIKFPRFVMDLPGYYAPDGLPTYLRILVKDSKPVYADVVNIKYLVQDLRWWICPRSGDWCHHYVEQDMFTWPVIYEMNITGNVTKVWEVADADKDILFQSFLETRRPKITTGNRVTNQRDTHEESQSI